MSSSIYFILSVVLLLVVFLHETQPQGANDSIVFKVLDQNALDIRYEGKWGQICNAEFDQKIAGAICQQMGMGLGSNGAPTNVLKVPLTQITIDKVECINSMIASCTFSSSPQDGSKCPVFPGLKQPLSVTLNCKDVPYPQLIYLTGGNAHTGVVEVVRGAERGVVCYDPTKGGNVANVACKQMGYSGGTATSISKLVGYKGKWFDVSCASGSEANLDGCSINDVTGVCVTMQQVQCTLTSDTHITFDVRLSQSSKAIVGATNGTVEVFQYGKWGVICDTGWDINDANVVCTQLGFKGAVALTGIPTDAKFGQGTGIVFWNNMQCSGEELSIAECSHDEVFVTDACNSVNASGVICSTEKLESKDICKDTVVSLEPGITFIRSPSFPETFEYSLSSNNICSLNITSPTPTNFTVYIQQKMFQNNHNEFLSFKTSDGRVETLYGDNSTQGPMAFDTESLTIEFQANGANGANGNGKFSIMVSVPQPPPPPPTPSSTAVSSATTGMPTMPNPDPIIEEPEAVNVGVIVGPIVGVVCLIVFGIIVIVLWKRGITCLGRKTRNPDGYGLYDETRVPGVLTGNGNSGNYVTVGGVYENVSEPVYVNSAFAADQDMEASRDSSDRRSVYENMGDIVFNQASNAGNTTASAEESTFQNQDNDANNSTAADGESQYAKLETVNRSEYADFRGLTAEQLKPI